MVFHYTNFIQETNTWWIRKVRPVWMTIAGAGLYFIFYRYYFFGKIQSNWIDSIPEEKQIELANVNKRDWGYNQHYKPSLEISMRKRIKEVLGDDYKEVHKIEIFEEDRRPLKKILEEENNFKF